jgi:hypothetical protein
MEKIALRAMPPAGIFKARKRAGDGSPAPAFEKAINWSFPGTVIGVPACTVGIVSLTGVKNSFLFLALNIPAGGSPTSHWREALQ